MYSSRRSFLASMSGAAAAAPVFHARAVQRLRESWAIAGDRAPSSLADDESYWSTIQRAFDIDRSIVNLNNGGVCPSPSHVLEQMIRDLRFCNEIPAEHMWRILEPRIETVRAGLAEEFGCDPEEMAITRNASESLETLIQGIDLKAGDEVVVTNQNYPRMLTTWDQRVRRHGIVVKEVSFMLPPPSDDYLVEQFAKAITPKTKVIGVTHITNLSGQIMPVRKIADMAR
ncbi:MAG TPA: aminotransferase class V-fold PLP-dependent enzyme, partial [Gemmatimonadales bacterium]|nr:aminotransferase class V-fold PLP-dependent enzyme [Gemmatimonadales bacterium]